MANFSAVSIKEAASTFHYMRIIRQSPYLCGYHGDNSYYCIYMPDIRTIYKKNFLGPLLDRTAMHLSLPEIKNVRLAEHYTNYVENSQIITLLITQNKQKKRYRGTSFIKITTMTY